MVFSLLIKRILAWIGVLTRIGYYAMAGYGLFFLVFWYVDYRSVIQFGDGSIHPKEVTPGTTVIVSQQIKKMRDCPGEVYRYLTGDCGIFPVMQNETIIPVDFDGEIKLSFTVPWTAQPGSCSFNSRHRYYCNPLDLLFNRNYYSAEPLNFRVLQ